MGRKKFQVGEKIFDNSKGEGEVVGYEYNHLFGDEEYVVKWSRDGKEENVEQVIADQIWSYIIEEPVSPFTPPSEVPKLPKSLASAFGFKIKMKLEDIKVAPCEHKHQIDVGFVFTKMVCKDCNIEIKS
jgi:hypothetical protein